MKSLQHSKSPLYSPNSFNSLVSRNMIPGHPSDRLSSLDFNCHIERSEGPAFPTTPSKPHPSSPASRFPGIFRRRHATIATVNDRYPSNSCNLVIPLSLVAPGSRLHFTRSRARRCRSAQWRNPPQLHHRAHSGNHGVGLRCPPRSRSRAPLARWLDKPSPSRARFVHRRRVHHSADLPRSSPLATLRTILWTRLGRELALLPLHARLRERVGRSCPRPAHRFALS